MNRFLFLALLCLFAAAGQAAAQKVSYDKFVEMFEQSLRLADEKGIDRVVRDNPVNAIVQFRAMYGALKRKADDAVAVEQTQALRAAWKRSFDTRTLDYVADWQDGLDAQIFEKNQKANQALAQAYAEYQRLKSITERRPWELLRDNLLKISQAFEQVGNAFEAADAWGLLSQVYNEIPNRTLEDRREAVFAMGQFKSQRDKWEFTKDAYYTTNVAWMQAEQQRIASGAEAEALPGANQPKGSGAEALLAVDADAREIVAPLSFSVMKKPPLDMCVQGGPVPPLWPPVTVQKAGPSAFLWFKGAQLFMVRPGASKFGVTTDGQVDVSSGKGWQPVDASNRIKKPSEFDLGSEDAPKPYAAWFYVGGEQEPLMGYTQNLAPTDESAVVYYKSAGQWTATVEGTAIVLTDDNSNGLLFEEDPFAYGIKDRHLGEKSTDETPVPAFDGMQIGRDVEQPYSEWIELDEQWYHVREKNGGTAIGLRPADAVRLEVGSIQLDWSGPKNAKPTVLIVQGEDSLSGARFNIAPGKPVRVPTGRYKVAFGRLESGKGARLMTASVFPGRMEPVEVVKGETTKVKIGAPFTLEFLKQDGDGGKVKVDGLTIRVRGVAGELYAHLNGAAPAPQVLIARDQEGHGAKEVAEFANIRDPELANQVAQKHTELGNQVGFYPVAHAGQAETAIEIEVPDGWFVGLKESKNKLLGDLQPAFR